MQLRQALSLAASKRFFVPQDGVFFEVESATDIAPRAAFKRLFESALSGGFKAIIFFVSDRLFRNLEQAIQIKRQFRLHGIELIYLGRYEGDPRNPAAWLLETTQDTAAEHHARTTGYQVGMNLEERSRRGQPVGGRPEVYGVGDRYPGLLGRRGSVKTWKLVQPLADILVEGCRRYLDGSSLSDLARWSATTELGGVTPRRRTMDKYWWWSVLNNPVYAGFQRPTRYQGFRPGKESPARERRHRGSELVPSQLPALWTFEDYQRITELMISRSRGPKVRRSYRAYLLSGIAYDPVCGHRMGVLGRNPDGHFWMRCAQPTLDRHHAPMRRADLAERELDELLAGLSFEDQELLRQIEEELRELSRQENAERKRFRADPAVGAVRQALATLEGANIETGRAELERKLAELERADNERREALNQPVADFRRALQQLAEWDKVWRSADMHLKNTLLREAGLRVEVGVLPGAAKRAPAHILSIAADNPVFALALGAALSKAEIGLPTGVLPNQSHDVPIYLSLPEELESASRALTKARAPRIALPRPALPRSAYLRYEEPPGGPWLTAREAALLLGIDKSAVMSRISRGVVDSTLVKGGGRSWRLIHLSEIERLKLEAGAPGRPPGHLTITEFSARSGLSRSSVWLRISDGRLAATRSHAGGIHGWWIAESELAGQRRLRRRSKTRRRRKPRGPKTPARM